MDRTRGEEMRSLTARDLGLEVFCRSDLGAATGTNGQQARANAGGEFKHAAPKASSESTDEGPDPYDDMVEWELERSNRE